MANVMLGRWLNAKILLSGAQRLKLYTLLRRYSSNSEALRQSAHSKFKVVRTNAVEVQIMPVLKDNYMYLLTDLATNTAAAIDPVEPDLITSEVFSKNLNLQNSFITHHHTDHAAGTEKMESLFPKMVTCAGDKRIKSVHKWLRDRDKIKLGTLTVHCLHTPCHTTGHYCFYVEPPNVDEGVIFTGDTLFQAGCGPFLEGTAAQMYDNIQIFYTLPVKTKVFGSHENTEVNLRFGLCIEPENVDMCKRWEEVKLIRGGCFPTPPSTLWQESLWNPFMRVNLPSVLQYIDDVDPIQAMMVLRKQRDTYK